MTDQSKTFNGSKWLMIIVAVINITIVPIMGWVASSIMQLHQAVAGMKPVVDRVQIMTEVTLDKSTYMHDWDKHDGDHRKIDLEMANIQTRLQEIRLDIAKFELQIQQQLQLGLSKMTNQEVKK